MRPTNATATDVDVAIIGGGPVGKMAAVMLGRKGHRVTVLERKDHNYPLPRAVAHDAEIARILQNIDMPVTSMDDTIEPYDDLYVWVNGADETLHLVDWRGYDSSGWNNAYFYNQPGLERHLEQRLLELPGVELRRGQTAVVEGQDDRGVAVGFGDETIRAQYLLAADGAKSGVRKQLEIPWTDLGYFHDWLVVDILPQENMEPLTLAKQVADPHRPTTVVPGGPGRRRWEFMRLEGETAEELTAPERIWQLLEPYGVRPDNATIERGVVYTFSSGWASRFRDGRIMLIGDAAHQMPPFAGQGLAAGIRDCMNLSWKLDLVLEGRAPDSLLDSFGPERQAHVSDFIDFSISLGRIICILDEEEAAERDRTMKTEMESEIEPEAPPRPRLGAGVHRGELGGFLSLQGWVAAEEYGEIRFDDIFGAGTLMVRDAEAVRSLDSELIDGLQEVGIAVTCFDPQLETTEGVLRFADSAGTYGDWFDGLDVSAVLIRPDAYVFGGASGLGGAEELAREFLAAVTDSGVHRTEGAEAV